MILFIISAIGISVCSIVICFLWCEFAHVVEAKNLQHVEFKGHDFWRLEKGRWVCFSEARYILNSRIKAEFNLLHSRG